MADEEVFQAFLTEVEDFTTKLENEYKKGKLGEDVSVYEIFRAFHTFKGSGALFDLSEFVSFAETNTEHFRPIQNDKKLSNDNLDVLKKAINDLKDLKSKFKA